MPMIEMRHQRIDSVTSGALAKRLVPALEASLAHLRQRDPSSYKTFLEVRRFGEITQNYPDVLVLVYYHDDWAFVEAELQALATYMMGELKSFCEGSALTCTIRLYKQSGNASAKYP